MTEKEYQYSKIVNDVVHSLTDWELKQEDNHINLIKGLKDNYKTEVFNTWEEVYNYFVAIGLIKSSNKIKEDTDFSVLSNITEDDIETISLKFDNLDDESITDILTLLEYVPVKFKQPVLDLLQIIINKNNKREVK